MGEQWVTVEDIREARERFEAAIPGWDKCPPYGLGRLNDDGSVELVRVDNGDHALPGVVLATVCGHVTGSASYVLTKADLARAIELLAPAEACTFYDHPNLAAWRDLHSRLADDESLIATFIGADPGDLHVQATRRRLAPSDQPT
jgi:hypothetical protein